MILCDLTLKCMLTQWKEVKLKTGQSRSFNGLILFDTACWGAERVQVSTGCHVQFHLVSSSWVALGICICKKTWGTLRRLRLAALHWVADRHKKSWMWPKRIQTLVNTMYYGCATYQRQLCTPRRHHGARLLKALMKLMRGIDHCQ